MANFNPFARRDAPPDAATSLWKGLRGRRLNGLLFERSKKIGRYRVGFVCRKARLVVELDPAGAPPPRDVDREAFIDKKGYEVMRFWDPVVVQNVEEVLDHIGSVATERIAAKKRRRR